MTDVIEDIKKLVREEKLVIGKDVVMKLIRSKKAKKVYLADNAPEDLKKDIENYKNISEFELVMLNIPNDELGTICKKPFSISVALEQK